MRILQIVNGQKGNIQLSLKAISEEFRVSEKHLGRAFRATTGQPFRLYLRDIRRSAAMQMLSDPMLSVKEVAFQLGYSNSGNFARDFKRMTRMTPGDYRSQHIGDPRPGGPTYVSR